ncbi:DUF3656 domain-containing U32 family peptidase [Tissierella creatinophila]|uniref:Putative protease YdcP n=1 Tax=Tissierella creatinophila DSM 6911 TaxID=1123403 RepID=A0A1U7M697_TISCR|nr:U32 family peptidase [Tissierella creatinophila]OLS02827.1 putative protease YdcP precursor [Tissierella creatinophila DSM 6911]
MNYNTELLAPVGSMESLYAAVQNGANAVYLGGKSFNARHFASNFSYDELREVIGYAHLNDVKVYITINILIENKEMEKALDYIRFLYEEDVDAIIVQDLGLAKLVHELFPKLNIHASTQMTINNLEGVKLLEELGFNRVVLARETPLEEIKRIKRGSQIELEGFIHGALCVSYSGQCLMSSVIGGRSGNRGRCAQPCRMPYSIVDKNGDLLDDWQERYLLSPKDLNTLDYIEEIINAGIHSLKIEGRMKRPEYVATIVETYRKVIDKNEKASPKEKEDVEQIFNRGFTKGVGLGDFGRDFISMDRPDNRGTTLGTVINTNRDTVFILLKNTLEKEDGIEFTLLNGKYKGMKSPISGKKGDTVEVKKIGNVRKNSPVYKSSSITLLKKAQESYVKNKNIYPINMEITIKIGQNPILKLNYRDYETLNHVDFAVQEAKSKGLTKEKIREQLSKLGDTQFSLNNLDINLDENSFLPLSVLNELRRDATYSLNKYLENKNNRDRFNDQDFKEKKEQVLNIKKHQKTIKRKLSVKVDSIEQLEQLDFKKLDRIYIPLTDDIFETIKTLKEKDIEVYISTEKILYRNDFKRLEKRLEPIKDLIDGVSVQNLGTLKFIKENYNFKIHGSTGLNIFNSYTVDFFKEMGVDSMTLSPELNLSQINGIEKKVGGDLESIVYGYLPVMTTKTCPMALVKGCKDDKECKTCNFANGYGLNDRMDKTFYISRKEGFTTIYNSVPLMVLDSMDQIYNSGINIGRLDFTIEIENIKEIQVAYHKYINGIWNEKESREFIETIKDTTEITKGHFFRGVV